MSSICTLEGCTVDETGRCALERDPVTCANKTGATTAMDKQGQPLPGAIGAPVLASPERKPSFPPSRSLGTTELGDLMARRYVTVVGILGEPESGKTACLASIYLLVSNDRLKGWSYADSSSLMGFDDIARGARAWNEGHPPEQLTLHTEMADERQSGFLHLRLKRRSDGRRIDLALPDLPGEWTKTLVRSSRTDRLEFLKSAEAVWLLVDGRAVRDREQRQGAITRLGQLAGRVRTIMGAATPRLLIVVTYRDSGELADGICDRLLTEVAKHGAEATVIQVAPFSDADACGPGFGLEALLDATVGSAPQSPPFWHSVSPTGAGRAFLAYRRDR